LYVTSVSDVHIASFFRVEIKLVIEFPYRCLPIEAVYEFQVLTVVKMLVVAFWVVTQGRNVHVSHVSPANTLKN
jgi:hypothetical protein